MRFSEENIRCSMYIPPTLKYRQKYCDWEYKESIEEQAEEIMTRLFGAASDFLTQCMIYSVTSQDRQQDREREEQVAKEHAELLANQQRRRSLRRPKSINLIEESDESDEDIPIGHISQPGAPPRRSSRLRNKNEENISSSPSPDRLSDFKRAIDDTKDFMGIESVNQKEDDPPVVYDKPPPPTFVNPFGDTVGEVPEPIFSQPK
eukprot:UN31418